MTPIRDRSELASALAQPKALVFLWVRWAIHAYRSREEVEKANSALQVQHPDESVPCYLADVSEQQGDLWDALAEWLTAEGRPAGELMMGGNGSLLWLRSGHAVLHVVGPNSYGAAKLAEATRSVFAS